MIPTIGIMIGGYIIFRCIELACRSESQFASKNARSAVIVFAVIGVLVTGFLALNLMLSGNSLSSVVAPFVEGSAMRESTGTSDPPPPRPEVCRDPHESPASGSGVCFCDTGYQRDSTTLKCVRP
jgi:hypothetical protein